jgi:hypothetical protein
MTLNVGQEERLAQLQRKRGLPPTASWQRMVEQLAEQVAARIKSGQTDSPFAAVIRSIMTESRTLNAAGIQLGRGGWTMPPWATHEQAKALSRIPPGPKLDQAILRIYMKDPSRLEELHEAILQAWPMRKWRPLYRQAVYLARRKQFLAVVPSLLLILEGLIVEAGAPGLKARPKDALKPLVAAGTGAVKAQWLGLQSFIDTVYSSCDFNGPPPTILNRHWVLHGRATPRWSQADCVRLFQAIATVCSITSRRFDRSVHPF